MLSHRLFYAIIKHQCKGTKYWLLFAKEGGVSAASVCQKKCLISFSPQICLSLTSPRTPYTCDLHRNSTTATAVRASHCCLLALHINTFSHRPSIAGYTTTYSTATTISMKINITVVATTAAAIGGSVFGAAHQHLRIGKKHHIVRNNDDIHSGNDYDEEVPRELNIFKEDEYPWNNSSIGGEYLSISCTIILLQFHSK